MAWIRCGLQSDRQPWCTFRLRRECGWFCNADDRNKLLSRYRSTGFLVPINCRSMMRNFNLLSSVVFPIDSSDNKADMMLNYTNGKLIIGAFHQSGVLHPTMPLQDTSWQPVMHKWEYDTSLTPLASPVYLNEIFTPWGSSCIYANNRYNIVTFDKWKGSHKSNFNLNVYQYDNNWNFIDSIPWTTTDNGVRVYFGMVLYFYLSHHSGHTHQAGNITLAIYDANWNLVYDTVITNYSNFVQFFSSFIHNRLQREPAISYESKWYPDCFLWCGRLSICKTGVDFICTGIDGRLMWWNSKLISIPDLTMILPKSPRLYIQIQPIPAFTFETRKSQPEKNFWKYLILRTTCLSCGRCCYWLFLSRLCKLEKWNVLLSGAIGSLKLYR